MSYGLDDEQAFEFREAFNKLDLNQTGSISTAKLESLFSEFGVVALSENEYSDFMAALDPSGTGQFNLDSYLKLMAKILKESMNEKEVNDSFRVFDEKNTGKVSTAELRHALTVLESKLSPDQITDMLASADPKNEGSFQYPVFTKKMINS